MCWHVLMHSWMIISIHFPQPLSRTIIHFPTGLIKDSYNCANDGADGTTCTTDQPP